MPAEAKPLPAKTIKAKITSKGQITIPIEIRRSLGAEPGDVLIFESAADGIRLIRQGDADRFEHMRGMGKSQSLKKVSRASYVTCASFAVMMRLMIRSSAQPADDGTRYKRSYCLAQYRSRGQSVGGQCS